MTAALLLTAQAALHSQIQARAIELGYDPAKVEPICDGVVDAVIESVQSERHNLFGRKYIDVIPLPEGVERWARSLR